LKSILKALTGEEKISADALLEYYKPLTTWLQTYLHTHKIDY
jgi:Angiotensin-converting enzyme